MTVSEDSLRRTVGHVDRPVSTGPPIEVACDESGSEGEHLIGGNTDVFAHGSVRIDVGAARACVAEVRDRVRSPATEYKANHLLRVKHRRVLEWVLGPEGPLAQRAHVHLTDKAFFVLDRACAVLVDDAVAAAETAASLRDQGPAALGVADWETFLLAANTLLRAHNPRFDGSPVDEFFGVLDRLVPLSDGDVRDALSLLRHGRPRAEELRARWLGERDGVPLLEPLIPAVVRTVMHWSSATGLPIVVVHDQTNALTDDRLEHLRDMLGPALARLILVDSQRDPRVQIADFLAGVARKLASEAMHGRAEPDLVALLRPYVDRSSVWAHPASADALGLDPVTRTSTAPSKVRPLRDP